MIGSLITSFGLLLDIIGVVLIFLFGIPQDVRRSGANYLVWGSDENEIKKAKRYDLFSYGGLGLLILGFAVQIIGNWQ